MGSTQRIALTGGAGSGKSAVAGYLRDRGITVIDTDQIAREVVEPGQRGLKALLTAFGDDILDGRGQLDRRALRARMLEDPSARETLEAILHPLIMQILHERLAAADGAYAVAEIPLLVESGRAKDFDRIITVEAPLADRLQRLSSRDQISEQEARQLIEAQASEEARRAIAHHVLENTGTLADLEAATEALHQELIGP